MVVPWALFESLMIGVLFLVYARHAGDCDRITMLPSGRLIIERVSGSQVTRDEINVAGARVHLQEVQNPKIEIRYAGKFIVVGSHVPLQRRLLVTNELNRYLRAL